MEIEKNMIILKCESEYKNGVKNWNGKEYNKNGEIIFVGEFFYDTRWN